MHLLLTDILSCPRCGPAFGLIVLADRIDDRLVLEGRLGCANCRESYRIEEGVADLRHESSPPLPDSTDFAADDERIFRAAALLGVTESKARVLIVAPDGETGRRVATIVPEVHVIAASDDRAAVSDAESGIFSPVRVGERVPLRSASVGGVALLGLWSAGLAKEAARVLVPGGRLVVDPAPEGSAEILRDQGFVVQLEQDDVVVAATPGRS